MSGATATVAIVGRPNVGKSTLFNRLVGRRQAIVHDRPGVTRDRIGGQAERSDGSPLYLIDTGGLVPGEDGLGLNEQVFLAVEESDLVLVVVDGKEGLTPGDEEVWSAMRRRGKPAVLVVNKGDVRTARHGVGEFYRLGADSLVLVSAEHGLGIGDLQEEMERRLPPPVEAEEPEAPALAIVGRPNVGKSSILNSILGQTRALVSETAGTTRDPVDTLIRRDGRSYLLIDTAGIRRRSKASDAPEALAVMMARRQIEQADLCLLVLDAAQGVTSGDLAIAGSIWELGRGTLALVNKWDLLDRRRHEALEMSWERLARTLAHPPRLNVSARTGRGLDAVFPQVDGLLERQEQRPGTGELNRLFRAAVAAHNAPHELGRPWRLYYVTQVSTRPPTFMLFANRTLPRGSPYRRYLENQVRDALGLQGIPVRLVIRRRGRGRANPVTGYSFPSSEGR